MPTDIRNLGIIAHVDHGKTTLVDAIFRQAGLFRENEVVKERVMDSNDQERERGITILSKVASCQYQGTKINIVDTPGHADFGGEVERVLSMVDGVLLVVDACEGPMPQTRFVLKKALDNGLRVICCVNKIDREGARPLEAYDKTIDLFIDLGADEDDLEFPVLYVSGVGGFARRTPDGEETDLQVLFQTIIEEIPAPNVIAEGPTRLQINNLDYSDYLGRIFGGKLLRGSVRVGDRLAHINEVSKQTGFTVTKVWVYEGLKLKEVEVGTAGEIVMLSGLDEVLIGDSVCDAQFIEPLPRIEVEPSTLTMNFYANNSPLAGKDGGKFLTIHKIRERLEREEKVSVSLKIDRDSPAETVRVKARGEMQLSVLIESMRREGFEMAIARPQVIFQENELGRLEPVEQLTCEFEDTAMGDVMEELSRRKAVVEHMETLGNGRSKVVSSIPTRGLIGFRSVYLTLTRGTGILGSIFEGYEQYRGPIESRVNGSLICKDPGKMTRYAYEDIQERGTLFYPPGTDTYGGMIVGMNSRDEDMVVNATKTKAATNMRSATSDDTTVLRAHKEFSLEQALSWLRDDELLEVTPKMLRFRKKILDHSERRVAERRAPV
ncbi:translational GTPase TypA [Kamptonema cortianum]|nr:translational GTPase TypA [Geitlerinema splendidum]MDK3162246.1 translational GTPase TypA [Kamptonema cortianum]